MTPRRHVGLLWALVLSLSLAPRLTKAATAETAFEEKVPLVGERSSWRTLAQRIPSVTRRTVTKAGRVELMPLLNFSLNDPFFQLIGGGGHVSYHFFEFLSAGLTGVYYADLARGISVSGPNVVPVPAYNRALYQARAEVAFAPLYGKISWLAEAVAHFDTYLAVSGGVMGLKQGGNSGVAGLALGQHYFFTPQVALRLELRHDWYKMNRVPGSAAKTNIQSLLSASVGVSFYLPGQARAKE